MKKLLWSLIVALMITSFLTVSALAAGSSFDTAREIGLSSSVSDNFTSSYQTHFYKFTIPSSGKVTFYQSGSVNTQIAVYDSTRTELGSGYLNPSSAEGGTDYAYCYLRPGQYYVTVGSRYNTGAYSFSVELDSSNVTCEEDQHGSNNTLASASAVDLGSEVAGMLAETDGLDFYKITLPSSGRLTVSFTAYTHITGYVYDASGEKLKTKYVTVDSEAGVGTGEISLNLSRGDYYIVVEGYWDSSTGEYLFTTQLESANVSFEEDQGGSNNSFAAASAIKINNEVRAQFSESDNVDYFKITLTEAGRLTVKFSALVSIKAFFYDDSGTQIWESYMSVGSSGEYVGETGRDLTAGTYFVVVEMRYETGNYKFTPQFVSAGETFKEKKGGSDNTLAKANTFKLRDLVNAQIAVNDNIDCFKFNLASAGKVEFVLSSGVTMKIKLYDAKKNEIASKNVYTDSVTGSYSGTLAFDLFRGDYFISFEGLYSETGNYNFRTTFASAKETFPENQGGSDNSYETANKIVKGGTYRGNIALTNDKDYYVLYNPAYGDVTFELTNESTLKIAFYNQNKGLVNSFWCGAGVGKFWGTLKQGNYWVVIEGDPGSYTLTYCNDNPFEDVAEIDYFYESVLWAVEKNITAGTSATTFSPNAGCTRGQVVTFLWRSAGSPSPSRKTNPFVDVKPSDYYYTAVLWAVEKGITKGTSNTTFSPGATCTRGQIVTFLHRSLGAPAPTTRKCPFKDVKSGDYFRDAVLWAVENNITKGMSSTSFAPDATCTRAQVVTFMYRNAEK